MHGTFTMRESEYRDAVRISLHDCRDPNQALESFREYLDTVNRAL